MTERYTEHVDWGVPRGGHEMTRLHWLVQHERPMTYGILQAGELVDGGVAYIGPSDITGEGASPELDALRTTAPEIAANYRRSVLVGGDVVVSIGPAYGKVAVVSDDLAGANLTQDTVRVALRPEVIDTRFLVWALLSSQTAEYWGYQIMGATFRRLNLGTLAQTPIPLPPLDKQRAIADYLDRETARIDTLIDEQQRLIEMLCERRRAAVEEAVAIVGTSGPRLKHIIRSVRQGWSPQCYSWSADGVETWAVLKAGAANGGRFRPMENKELPEDEIPRPDIVVTRGDLIVSRANTRELVGSAAVVEGDFPRLMLCDKLYAFSLDESRADSRFVAAVLGSRRWRDLIELEATGASHSMLNISQSDIVNLPMPLPPVDEQRQIIAHLDSETAKIDQLIAETERFIELARERRSALVTAAVTGQIDVREAA
ncbi:restriction endonuclease subunit S [Sphaerisporangium dianthi]|uniref:Restriction endonuclease subunit S n=1 Tax=Sphaerisporangium dianthi TaxID=1436120 RepID=A0ABV9CUJ4_9ACTN